MTFLAPIWLLLGALAAVPLLLHLLRRRIGSRVEFPAVRYLLRAEREHSRRLKLRNLLLMFLRVLVVILVALAAARPIGNAPIGGHPPTALAIVLDNSLSTTVMVDGRSVFERLRAAALGLAQNATDADRLWLVTADAKVAGGSRASIIDAISRVEPLAGSGELGSAIARAASAVAASEIQTRRVAVVSDGQASAWPPSVNAGDTRVSIYAPELRTPPNRSVAGVRVSPARWTPSGSVAIRVAGTDSAVFRLALGRSPEAMRTLARGTATSGSEVTTRASPPERGWLAGAAELSPDELRGDDTRWFATWAGPPPRVSLSGTTGPFVASAVESLIESGRVGRGTDVQVASADALPGLPAMIFAPDSPVRVGAANREFARLGIPWRLGSLRTGTGQARGSRMDGVQVSRRYALIPESGAAAETLAVVDGEPWIVSGDNYVLVASPISPDATNLPLRAVFVPWLADMLAQRLSAEAGVAMDVEPGESVPRPARADALELPGGDVQELSGETLVAPDRSGVYFLRRGADRIGSIVVNPPPAESDLRALGANELRARIRGSSVDVRSGDPGRWATEVWSGDTRRPLEGILLVLALLLLGAETLVTRRAERGSEIKAAA